MSGNIRHTVNMANSIIGVSILSMPYCFKETGLLLGVILLLFSGFITKKTCMFLIQSAIMSRRRSYELLAFQIFGVTGKLLMELCMILFLMGICISFHVVIGDLAPAMAAKYLYIENTPSLRCTLLIGMVLLVILPLCFLRNLDSLASMSACSIGFYVFLNGVIFSAALSRLLDGSWIVHAVMFRFENVFRILPIMTLALACQSNVFEIYYSIPEPDIVKMRTVVSQAVNLCCALYTGVGFLGYVAFIGSDIGGNAIMNLPSSKMTDGIRIFFVVSLAISFPLMLFPCRTSIHSLLYRSNITTYDIAVNFIPEYKFKVITVCVLSVSLLIGILIPNIEFVLGLLGSTMGMIIALIFPSLFFIKVYTKTSLDRLMAQAFLILGTILMVTGTYLHLSGTKFTQVNPIENMDIKMASKPINIAPPDQIRPAANSVGRKEPAIPEPPLPAVNDANVMEKKPQDQIRPAANSVGRKEPAIPEPPLPAVNDANVREKKPPDQVDKKKVNRSLDSKMSSIKPINNDAVKNSLIDKDVVNKKNDVKIPIDQALPPENIKKEVPDNLNPDAILKEEKENAEEVKNEPQKEGFQKKQEMILKQMENQQKEQKQLIEEQKKILKELKIQQNKVDPEQLDGDNPDVAQNEGDNNVDAQNAGNNDAKLGGDKLNAAILEDNQNIEQLARDKPIVEQIEQDNLNAKQMEGDKLRAAKIGDNLVAAQEVERDNLIGAQLGRDNSIGANLARDNPIGVQLGRDAAIGEQLGVNKRIPQSGNIGNINSIKENEIPQFVQKKKSINDGIYPNAAELNNKISNKENKFVKPRLRNKIQNEDAIQLPGNGELPKVISKNNFPQKDSHLKQYVGDIPQHIKQNNHKAPKISDKRLKVSNDGFNVPLGKLLNDETDIKHDEERKKRDLRFHKKESDHSQFKIEDEISPIIDNLKDKIRPKINKQEDELIPIINHHEDELNPIINKQEDEINPILYQKENEINPIVNKKVLLPEYDENDFKMGFKLKNGMKNKLVNYEVYDTRQLLGYFSKFIPKKNVPDLGRRKNKYKLNSDDYWDEM